ncbi:HNH endonuclease signature motif containing protein [Mesorhizobium sp. M7A.F.Ca.ET.027.03.2.1]|uniref:HNH endonuclease signature motif containing protein n=1 Tax=Mesorhizobium sp. M7A.F.Ca.ET.027.03.2.1 TaxID=2496656 RepID=UPI000FCCC6A7|nr:HNH endonuclease signature motif containing protein [Mesorhizobium sp. M7A.F.Ca.ET.027.03.2.1]RVD50042.1 HNH endonuclease [Mesorhizobium sp. M7A.F.Ca.ET.027.03.2.1]
MPSKGPRLCACGRVVPPGLTCVCAKARKATADSKRPSARARGYDGDWQAARAKHLASHPSCVECGEPATLVDHIVSIRKAPHRRLDPTNFASMCPTCHGRKTAAVDGSFGRAT